RPRGGGDAGGEVGGGGDLGSPQQGADVGDGHAERPALRAGEKVRGELGGDHSIERAVEIVREKRSGAGAPHCPPAPASMRRRAAISRRASSSRPRLMRLLTVPSGICSVVATSS